MADRRPLIQETSDISESAGSTPALQFTDSPRSHGFTHIPPPTSPPISRPGFSRLQSEATAVERHSAPSIIHEEGDVLGGFRGHAGDGLGIGPTIATARRVSIQTVPQRAVGPGPKSPPLKSPGTLSPPGSSNPFTDSFPKDSSTENTPDLRRERYSPREDVGSYEDFRRGVLKNARQSTNSVNEYQQYIHTSDTDRLRAAPSIKSAYESDFRPTHECPTTRDFYQSRFTWLNISIIIICLFSCIFSGIFVGLAIREQFWGKRITSHGPLTPANANLLTQVFAKLIELSFITSFVAFLGQVLSRRAFMKDHGRGVTLSELSMWRWVVQPGTLITHWETAKYAGLSFLGILSLVCAILGTLYSSASTALVQPTLRQGSWKPTVMSGLVKTDFANMDYVKGQCKTPIRNDKDHQGNSCLQIEHAGQAYHNYQRYLADWANAVANGNGSTDQQTRPRGFGLLHENTTITAQWINTIDTAEVSKKYGRPINNVSLAMPHSGVFEAAHSPRNGILQPEDLNSEGTYSLKASVPSPVINVLCVNMNEEELAPIVYDKWNTDVVNISSWKEGGLMDKATTSSKTKVDELFGWNNDSRLHYPPVFAKYPKTFNTIMNHTSKPWGRSAIYLLAQGGPNDDVNMTGVYSLCKLDMSITSACVTQYNARSGGGVMESFCEDKAGDMAYGKRNPDAQTRTGIPNWRDIGFDWSNSLSLQTGIMDGDASNSRILSQMMLSPTNPDPENMQVNLSPALPSMGEALAVMAGCTLLMSMMDAPFVTHPWNYTLPKIENDQFQYFHASIQAQQYASGGVDSAAARAWVVVLILVFLLNIFVLIYFILHRGLVTDFSEPPNLFALAVNSPPSHVLAGSCGGGPEGKQYMVNWFVNREGNHLFMEPGEKTALLEGVHAHGPVEVIGPQQHQHANGGWMATVRRRLGMKSQPPQKLSPAAGKMESLRQERPGSLVGSEYEMRDGYERTRKHYNKLANRRSVL
ncbi:hypothetical protein HBI22_073020 [Parastagonospora nodorum]|nr:hypothetical protein HBI28_051920 [Parastagonospora nodorum]KAH5638578.1 hypothetical protein HBI22_073020 [Parastagonospora nodorum]KAH5680574.1 hypothetical protein HBI21_064010 [Parastagonospora nodorum]